VVKFTIIVGIDKNPYYEKIMQTLKQILSQMGFINETQMQELATHFPNTGVIIQYGGMPREKVRACEVVKRIKHIEDNDIDYVRQCFISSKEYRMLEEVFGIGQDSEVDVEMQKAIYNA
jgi:hypothetical protein|tara:strand:- start:3151 stop:3507 length:357 start_codon:yes stop_codon:yes gene_type:complete